MQPMREPLPSENLFWPVVWAVSLHLLIIILLFVSFHQKPTAKIARIKK